MSDGSKARSEETLRAAKNKKPRAEFSERG